MPEEKEKTVDIDTSGPDAEVSIEETKDEAVIEQPEENTEQETVTQETTEEPWCLLHDKTIDRQEKQNKLYEQL